MTKIVLVILLLCLIAAGLLLKNKNRYSKSNPRNHKEDCLKKHQLCPQCKIGKESYELDRHSESCPYRECWKDGRCDFFQPMD